MTDHPFIHSPEQYEEYLAACEAFADTTDQLPDPPAEILISEEPPDDSNLDTYWEDQSEYGCGDF